MLPEQKNSKEFFFQVVSLSGITWYHPQSVLFIGSVSNYLAPLELVKLLFYMTQVTDFGLYDE